MHRQFSRNVQLRALIASLRCGCADPVRTCRMWKRVKKCNESCRFGFASFASCFTLLCEWIDQKILCMWVEANLKWHLITISHKHFLHHNTSQLLCNFDCLWAVSIPSILWLLWPGSLSAICAPHILGQLELHMIYPVPSNVMNVTAFSGIKWIKWHFFGSFTCLHGQVHPLHRFIA